MSLVYPLVFPMRLTLLITAFIFRNWTHTENETLPLNDLKITYRIWLKCNTKSSTIGQRSNKLQDIHKIYIRPFALSDLHKGFRNRMSWTMHTWIGFMLLCVKIDSKLNWKAIKLIQSWTRRPYKNTCKNLTMHWNNCEGTWKASCTGEYIYS